MTTATQPDPEHILAQWLERDLSAAAGGLPPACDVEGELDHAAGVLGGGHGLLLVGEPGIGKSALITELVRRIPVSEGLRELSGASVLQLSVGLRLSRLAKDESLHEAFAALADALPRLGRAVLAYFRDGDLLYQTGLAAQLERFCLRQRLPVIVEGRPAAMSAMLEVFEELEQHFVTLTLTEPDVRRALGMVRGWAHDPNGGGATRFDDAALEEAVYLGHRFLARGRLPRKAIDLLHGTAALAPDAVDADAVMRRFCAVHATPRWLVDPAAPLALDALEERFRAALLGQEDAVSAALATIATVKAGLSDLRRPFGVFLFVGPTGVGKTHLARLLAGELFGSPERLVAINMGDHAGPRGAEALFGDPEHHLPANRRGVLTQRLTGRSFGVVLLDELEKASPAVHDRLLPLIDEGCFVNGAGETVSCRSSIIIATSNAGAEVYRETALGFTTPSDLDSRRREMERRMRLEFRFELLNRFDQVVHFHPLSRDEIRSLAAREIAALAERPGLKRAAARVTVDDAVLDWLAAHGYDAEHGARFLKRTVEREVTTALAAAIATRPVAPGESLVLELRRGRIRARRDDAAVPATAPAPARGPPGAATEGLSAEALLERAAPRLEALGEQAAERDRLLAEMAQPEFWEDSARRDEVTERFRELDLATRLAARHAAPVARVREALERGEALPAGLLESAAEGLRAWEERERLEGPSRVWLVLSAVDARAPVRDWMLRLARMYLGWARLSGLRCAPAAFEPRAGDVLSRLVLEVEGPGAEHYLDPERGVHRQRRSGASDALVRVDVVPQESDGFGVDVRDRALLRGPFALMAELESTLTLPHTGQKVTLAGASRATLAGLAGDLEAAWAGLRVDSPQVVRSYGEPGGVVVDPRTGASGLLRTVERGQLGAFLEAWERHRGS